MKTRFKVGILQNGIIAYMSIINAKPFVKWAGGKRRLVHQILMLIPVKFQRYLEPFVGGGSVAFAIGFYPMMLNDANSELINTYIVIRDSWTELIAALDEHRLAHSADYFYEIRKVDPASLSPVAKAARFIYLNKTAYNGLYRVNRYGQFNVPFGRYTNPNLYDLENMKKVSKFLQGVMLSSLDFLEFLENYAAPGDLIYLDPPYHPISQYSDFKRYTKEQFRESDQMALASCFDRLVSLGAYPILSNSYSELTLDLYKNHNIQIVESPRNINQDGKRRGYVREILVTPRNQ